MPKIARGRRAGWCDGSDMPLASWSRIAIANAGSRPGEASRRPTGPSSISAAWDMIIQPWSMVKRLRLNETLLGACTASTDDRRHTQALVSYGRVDFLAFQWDIERASILGAAAAHEIGHLLLRQTYHSKLGIMRAEFRKEDFQYFNWRHLRFTEEQTQAMRAEVLARFRGAKTSDTN